MKRYSVTEKHTPEEVNPVWRVSQEAREFKMKDMLRNLGGWRRAVRWWGVKRGWGEELSMRYKTCVKILKQGKAGFKNKISIIIINNNKTEFSER